MKDSRLAELNFVELLNYGGQPPVLNRYPQPVCCEGYCVSCEDAGLLEGTGKRLDKMSHGCDSSDFEAVLGPLPNEGPPVERPILFLLENPGGDYKIYEEVPFRGFRKRLPVWHYYWTPDVTDWPSCAPGASGNFYGPYFAYLMRRHQLKNVYITNLVKCKWTNDEVVATEGSQGKRNWRSDIVNCCVTNYLARELKIFDPVVAFCFGRKAEAGLRNLLAKDSVCSVRYLLHPAAIQLRARALGMIREEMIRQNDQSVMEAIRHLF